MKHAYFIVIITLASSLTACMTNSHHYTQNAQKIAGSISAKYPSDKTMAIFIDAPEGFIVRKFNNTTVENCVDTGKVAAIVSALALKTNAVIVAGEYEELTAITLTKALITGKDKITGSKAIIIGVKEPHKTLVNLAAANGVALGFIDNPI